MSPGQEIEFTSVTDAELPEMGMATPIAPPDAP